MSIDEDEFIPSKTKIISQKFIEMTIAQKFSISINIGQTSQFMVEFKGTMWPDRRRGRRKENTQNHKNPNQKNLEHWLSLLSSRSLSKIWNSTLFLVHQ